MNKREAQGSRLKAQGKKTKLEHRIMNKKL
jgi:hypothetical protein